MMSELTRKRDEAARLQELYTLYKDSDEDWRRRKTTIDLDRFLMENRELAIMCVERVLSDEIVKLADERRVKRGISAWWLRSLSLRGPWRKEARVDDNADNTDASV